MSFEFGFEQIGRCSVADCDCEYWLLNSLLVGVCKGFSVGRPHCEACWLSSVFLSTCVSSACRRPQCPGGAGGGGAGGDRPADGRLAGDSDAVPGSPPLLGHHLLAPRVCHPAQAVGEDPGHRRPAADAVLQEGIPGLLRRERDSKTLEGCFGWTCSEVHL